VGTAPQVVVDEVEQLIRGRRIPGAQAIEQGTNTMGLRHRQSKVALIEVIIINRVTGIFKTIRLSLFCMTRRKPVLAIGKASPLPMPF
jgi:hypothetical protein